LWEEGDELERPTQNDKRTMVTAFFNDTGEYFLKIFPRSRSMDTKYSAEETVGGLEDVCCSEGRNPHERRITLHFDNAPRPNTRTAMGQLDKSGSKRMEHLAHSQDMAPCDFLLFGYMK
jgi:hypothetical protein